MERRDYDQGLNTKTHLELEMGRGGKAREEGTRGTIWKTEGAPDVHNDPEVRLSESFGKEGKGNHDKFHRAFTRIGTEKSH